jgi:WD40 repeat protein
VGDRFGDVLILVRAVRGRRLGSAPPLTQRALAQDPATLAPRPREFGHLAHVTELLVLPASGGGGPLLVSADTEGKVRVSRAQQLYVVEHFLLEHFAFVSSVAALRGPGGEQLLVSGGGDGFVRVWDPRSGREIARACLDPRQQDKAKLRGGIVDFAARFDVGDVVTRVAVDPRTQLVAVAVHPQPRVLLFALRGDELRAHGEILLQGTPSDIAFASDGRLLVAADGAPLTFFAREGDGWRRVEDAAAAAAAAALAALPARGGAFAAEQQARLRELYQKRLRFEERRRRNAKRPKGGEDGAATAAAAAAAPAAAGEAMDESKDGEEEAEEEEEEEEEGEEREGEEEEAEEDGEEDT